MGGVRVRGVGVTGGFGSGVAALREALGGQPPPPRIVTIPSEGSTLAIPVLAADIAPLERFVDRRALRRVDRFSKLALLAAHLALEDAGMTTADVADAGLVVASGYGSSGSTFAFLDSVMDGGDPCASPTAFSASVHNAAAANLSIVARITGPCLTVSDFELSLHAALLSAIRWLEEERVDRILLAAVDEFGPVVGYCHGRFFGVPDPGSFDPLDLGRQNAIPGEGAACFVLEREEGDGGRGTGDGGRSYGTIASVASGTGSFPRGMRADELLVLGADGNAGCSRGYAEMIARGPAVSWSRLYGSYPTGCAMDLAAALICARDGLAYPTPGAGTAGPLGGRPVHCLKAGAEGWGIITVGGCRGEDGKE